MSEAQRIACTIAYPLVLDQVTASIVLARVTYGSGGGTKTITFDARNGITIAVPSTEIRLEVAWVAAAGAPVANTRINGWVTLAVGGPYPEPEIFDGATLNIAPGASGDHSIQVSPASFFYQGLGQLPIYEVQFRQLDINDNFIAEFQTIVGATVYSVVQAAGGPPLPYISLINGITNFRFTNIGPANIVRVGLAYKLAL
jgi:hypothetical protein